MLKVHTQKDSVTVMQIMVLIHI